MSQIWLMQPQTIEARVVALLRAERARPVLEGDGWQVLSIDDVGELSGLHEGASPRLVVVGAGRASAAGVEDLVGKVRGAAPLVDVVVWKKNAPGNVVRAALRAGAVDVVLSEEPAALAATMREVLERQHLLPQVEELSQARHRGARFEGMYSKSDAMWEIFTTITRTASSDATVLITGETGTGKDLLARAVHRRSKREGRFVAVNCSAIRPEIVESELFGHERGAFTGAHQAKEGLFRHADGGTLLLDEIGDMPPEAQLSLLRVLQEERLRPVGSTREIPVNVRVVAATNAPLSEQVRHGTFREDLFYRLDVIRLAVPPLRERPEDVLYLFGHFLRALSKRYGVARPNLDQNLIDRLVSYDWPGNVRQLENTAERLVLEGNHDRLTLRDLNRVLPRVSQDPERPAKPPPTEVVTVHPTRTLAETLEPAKRTLEKRYLEAILIETRGRVGKAAGLAGISRRTMVRKMKEYQIDKMSYRAHP